MDTLSSLYPWTKEKASKAISHTLLRKKKWESQLQFHRQAGGTADFPLLPTRATSDTGQLPSLTSTYILFRHLCLKRDYFKNLGNSTFAPKNTVLRHQGRKQRYRQQNKTCCRLVHIGYDHTSNRYPIFYAWTSNRFFLCLDCSRNRISSDDKSVRRWRRKRHSKGWKRQRVSQSVQTSTSFYLPAIFSSVFKFLCVGYLNAFRTRYWPRFLDRRYSSWKWPHVHDIWKFSCWLTNMATPSPSSGGIVPFNEGIRK